MMFSRHCPAIRVRILLVTALLFPPLSAYAILPVSVCMKPGQMAISFDWGPSTATPALLTMLERLKVPVVFHIDAGKVERGGFEAIMERIGRSGHTLGMGVSREAFEDSKSQDGLIGTLSSVLSKGKGVKHIKLPAGFEPSENTLKDIIYAGYIL